MNILVACEESQAVTKELRALGHEAYSCDIIECSGGHPEWHIKGDVIPLLNREDDGNNGWHNIYFTTMDGKQHCVEKWDMIIAFPPCTHLAVSGAAWFEKKRNDGSQREGIDFFGKILQADCEMIAVENPVNIVGGDYLKRWFPDLQEKYDFKKCTQIIQPYEYGHNAKKATCLWLKNLPKLLPTNIVDAGEFYVSPKGRKISVGSSSDMARDENGKILSWNDPRTAKIRSKTFPGIAKAMAEQWAGDANKKEERKREMELKIYNPTEDGFVKAIEWNHEEIKAMVSEKVSYYKGLVYTEDEIKSAKTDRATLNKFVAALETKRKEIKKQCLAPYEDFEKKMKEIVAIVNEPINLIDSQVKAYEEKQKQEKLEAIKEYFNSLPSIEGFESLSFEQVFDSKWLNASVSMKSVEESISNKCGQIITDLETLANLPEFGFEATEVYKTTLDLNKALNEGRRLSEIQKRKAEHEAEQARLAAEAEAKKQEETMTSPADLNEIKEPGVYVAEPSENNMPKQVSKQWVSFKAHLTVDQAMELKKFFDDRCIEFESI